jgi:hypothetical protein
MAATVHVVDAMDGRGALDYRIKPIDADSASFAGPALTCHAGADDNLAILAAFAVARPGDVLVAACDGFTETAVVGDLFAGMARNCQVAAIVTDGLARDTADIIATGLLASRRYGTTDSGGIRRATWLPMVRMARPLLTRSRSTPHARYAARSGRRGLALAVHKHTVWPPAHPTASGPPTERRV